MYLSGQKKEKPEAGSFLGNTKKSEYMTLWAKGIVKTDSLEAAEES